MKPLQLIAVSAGLGDPSSTRLLTDRLADSTRRHLDTRTAQLHVVELRELAADIAGHLTQGYPNPVLAAAIAAVSGADGLIAVTPIFNASYSGLFKSFFDLIEPAALEGTPTLLAATGGTARHSLALEHALRPLFTYLHAIVTPTSVYAATEDWGRAGDTYALALPARIDRAAGELADLMLTRTPTTAGDGNDAATAVVPFDELLAGLSRRA